MIPDNRAGDGDGRWYPPTSHNGNGEGTQLARLVTRQLGRRPGAPGWQSRFLMAHACWILAVTLAVVAASAMFAFSRTPLYRSQAQVVVEPAPTLAGGGAQQPDMSTEASVAASGVVLGMASHAIGVPVGTLAHGLSVSAHGSSYVLQISYSDSNPHVAQQRAQAIAQAYTAFRSQKTPRNLTAPTATMITLASLPASPYSPDYVIDVVAALIVGLALGIATAWGRDYLDDRLRGPLDLERQADTDVLALIPAFRPPGSEPRHRLAVAMNSDSIVTEAYRGLRTRVLLTAAARNSRTLLVTSPAWEDRGTVAANLAAALAQAGHSIVLVCADLRWGSAHLLLGRREGIPGLSGLLERRTELAGALETTLVPGLQLLPPGAVSSDPAALLEQLALRAVLNEIRSQADFVVIEAPPVLASPDAQPLASAAEMVLLIADARETTRAQVRAAVRELRQARARLVGGVLVNVGRRRRLTAERLDDVHDHPARGQSRGATVSLRSQTSPPGTALAGQGTDITEELPWPNGS